MEALPENTCYRYEHGRVPPPEILLRMAHCLEVSPEDLLAGEVGMTGSTSRRKAESKTKSKPAGGVASQFSQASDAELLSALVARSRDANTEALLVREAHLLTCQRIAAELLRRC